MKTKLNYFLIILLTILSLSFKSDTKTTYFFDTAHTFIQFEVERFSVGEVSGKFNEFSGTIDIDENNYKTMNVDIKINAKSLDTGHKVRDGHLTGKTWLDTEMYPEILFKSTKIVEDENNNLMMEGDFTIHGITNKISFLIKVMGPFKDPTKKTTIGIKADFTIDRNDYGINFSKIMDNGSLFIGKEVKIKIRALAIQQ